MRVLIVEDQQPLGEIYRDYVRGLGHHPIVTIDAESALEKLLSERPDTILLDVRLPGMSGVEFLGLASVRESGVPVVAISGVATEGQARECLRLGALDFIRKPVSIDHLRTVLTYLEPFARARPRDEERAGPGPDPAPAQLAVDFPVRLVSEKGAVVTATCTALSATGMTVRTRLSLRPGRTARLTFTPPDDGAPIDVDAIVVSANADGPTLSFLDLQGHDARRLGELLQRRGRG